MVNPYWTHFDWWTQKIDNFIPHKTFLDQISNGVHIYIFFFQDKYSVYHSHSFIRDLYKTRIHRITYRVRQYWYFLPHLVQVQRSGQYGITFDLQPSFTICRALIGEPYIKRRVVINHNQHENI